MSADRVTDAAPARREPGAVTREEAAAMLFSGDYDDMTAAEFAARYPCPEVTAPGLPVAAPDPAAHDFVVLRNTSDRSLYFLDEQGYYHDTDCRGCRIDTLLVERQQDKERIERLETALGRGFVREGDDLIYLRPDECAVILHHREADALLGVLESVLNEGVKTGIGLRVEDAKSAGFKLVSERWRDQDPYNRGARVVAVAFRDPAAALAVEEDAGDE